MVGDHQSKPDIGVAIARQWFDSDNVDMVIGFDNSSVALAVEQVAHRRTALQSRVAVATTDFTGKACTANEAAWVYESYALTTSVVNALVKQPSDYKFIGQSLAALDISAKTSGQAKYRHRSVAPEHGLRCGRSSAYPLRLEGAEHR